MEMIRIAIPIFHHRVSPVLDTCTRLLIIDYEGQTEVDRREVAFDMYSPSERFEIVKKLNPDAIICCGISELFDRMLQSCRYQADLRHCRRCAAGRRGISCATASMPPASGCPDLNRMV
jgi:hypothetical protein